jgi:nucleotide-binding universal stress UspA family protein
MKILATFDGTPFSESTFPLLDQIAALPNAEFTLLRIGHEPQGRRRRGRRMPVVAGSGLGQASQIVIPANEPQFVETKEQAVERHLSEIEGYLLGLAKRLPKDIDVHIEAHVSDDIAKTIIARAREIAPDVIVMATHSRRGLGALFGSTTEQVVRSSVAPVLLVHPNEK